MEQRDLGELFLICFLQSIASVSKPSQEIAEEKLLGIQPKEIEKKITIEMLPEGLKPLQSKQQGKKIIEIDQKNRFIGESIPQRKFLGNRKYEARENQQFQKVEINQKSISEKLNFLIKDPAVTEIECIDSEQNLLVKKGGVIQKTPIKLSIEEVYQLIAEFSQKTKIPVIDGTIKAALNNLILTAILSEMLGPRFILQKKNPFQQLVQN